MTIMRRPRPSEYSPVRALIERVANETFGDLFAPNPVPLKFEDEDWPLHGWPFLVKRLWVCS